MGWGAAFEIAGIRSFGYLGLGFGLGLVRPEYDVGWDRLWKSPNNVLGLGFKGLGFSAILSYFLLHQVLTCFASSCFFTALLMFFNISGSRQFNQDAMTTTLFQSSSA